MNSSKGLLILEEEDFKLLETNVEGRRITHLVHTLDGFSIVMFYTDQCDQCKIIKPILLKFVGNPNVQICMVNVYDPDSVKLIEMSQKSSTVLQHVPFIVFYINGVPFKKFDGNYTMPDFQKFVQDVTTEASKIKNTNNIADIPPYTIGKPNSSKVCYLTYQKAY